MKDREQERGPVIKLRWDARRTTHCLTHHQASVEIDGQPMRGVRSVSFKIDGGAKGLPTVTLEFLPGELDVEGPVEAILRSDCCRPVTVENAVFESVEYDGRGTA